MIDLRRIDADASTRKDDAFLFIGDKPFRGDAGELRCALVDNKGTANDWTVVTGYVDGDKKADLEIHVAGLHKFVESDFLL